MLGAFPAMFKSFEMSSHLQGELILISPYVLMLLPK